MKKKVLVLGSSGMIGHMIYYFLKKTEKYLLFNVAGTRKVDSSTKLIDVHDFKSLEFFIREIKPDFIINCIGILINESNKNIHKAIYLNALFPHLLKNLSYLFDFKLIHISTDCVFSGKKKDFYTEFDDKDGFGNYAKTKGLGEIIDERNLTIRTSVVGPELKSNGEELFDWFMSQEKEINGFTNAYWSGVTTIVLAKSIIWFLDNELTGLYNLTNCKKISKNDLLNIIKYFTKKNIKIKPIKTLFSDKSFLDTRQELGIKIPSYEFMISELVDFIKNNLNYYPHYNIK